MSESQKNDGWSISFRIGGFATGAYYNKCSICGEQFIGDKYAYQCLDCVIKKFDELLVESHDQQYGVCNCGEYKKWESEIDGIIHMAAIHGTSNNLKPIKFCPHCGKSLKNKLKTS